MTAEATVAYDDAPFVPFHLRVCIGGTGGVFADGFGLGIIGIALSLAAPQLQLGPVWQGLLGGASLAGLFAGALLTGPVADHHGRRAIFRSNMLFAAALSAAQFFAGAGGPLLLLRLGIGFLLGTDYVVSKTLLVEYMPRRVRGRILGQLSVAWAGGYACAYAVGYLLAAEGAQAWRWMLLSSAAPCLLVAPLRFGIPESPMWLANHRRPDRAAAVVLQKLGPRVRPPCVHAPATAAQPAAAPALARAAWAPGRWRQLFSSRWRTRTLVGCVFFACQVVPYFALGTFVTQVMSALHLNRGYLGGLLYNFGLFGGAIVGVLIVDRLPRRTFLVGSFAAAAVTLLALSLLPQLTIWAMILLFSSFACIISAASNLVYVYLPELFPTNLRASGIGLAIAASRVGSAASTFVLPVIMVAYGVRTALGACVAVLAVGGLVCYRWAPETRNITLEAIEGG